MMLQEFIFGNNKKKKNLAFSIAPKFEVWWTSSLEYEMFIDLHFFRYFNEGGAKVYIAFGQFG